MASGRAPQALLLLAGLCALCAQAAVVSDFVFSFDLLYPKDFWCPEMKLSTWGVDTFGTTDVSQRLLAVDASMGSIIFMEPGRYRLEKSITLRKPIYAQQGAVFELQAGVTLTLLGAVSHPATPFFVGPGSVSMPYGLNPVVPVEWMGARGDGLVDDSNAIQRAINVAAASNGVVVFGAKTYGLGGAITKPATVRFQSEEGAVLKALKPGITGVIIQKSISRGVHEIPSLVGFQVAMQAAGLSHLTVPTIEDCETGVWLRHSGDKDEQVGVLVEVDTMRNVARAVVFTADKPGKSLLQGNEVTVENFIDTKGVAKALVHYTAPNLGAWDSSTLTFGTVDVRLAQGFAVLRNDITHTKALRENVYITKALLPLGPGSKLVDGWIGDCTFRVALTEPFKLGQLDMQEVSRNNFIFTDVEPWASKVYPLATTRASLAAFNGGLPVHSTTFTVQVPGGQPAWPKGQSRRFYFYHQLAQKQQLYYLVQPTYGGMCMPNGVAVTGLFDNSGGDAGSPYEVMVALVACKDLPAGASIQFPLLAGSVGT